MYDFLRGILVEKEPVRVVLDCSGIGYILNIPLSTFDDLPELGEELKLLVHYNFNESEGVRLYGFFHPEERELFRLLLGVSKIGPRTAIAVLSTLSVDDFRKAVVNGNTALISTVPGLGKKSSERLILELKDKISIISGSSIPVSFIASSIASDAEAALQTLGYPLNKIRKTLAELMENKNCNSAEELIKETIKGLHSKRN